ncbi:helix-turn-helix transcriptional regulator [Aggregicoccus sp. 17bor-14]|uniref:helix-turn-helix domain-containing protein n=1 Tax=Myxococcaceae TaxID=31 RepID=UPI00129CE1D9|nr:MULTISPECIES: helix-turn-helix transcriptional regulator [Myxococcaceae]MBF5042321.1 helix-turn-helix transcriptional regulator [Simulacricoccus sp. 17bor-14]MRI88095.1 helix-turn-helix transcriptional regulator [Aggregicoccus sp. 17bor-14]
MAPAHRPVGDLLREWRQRRHLSQLELAGVASVSARHLSFLETGRSQPSREMLLLLARRLEVPLRERNALLTAAGYAPIYRERSLDDPALAPARAAVQLVLAGHEPSPALAVDRHWNLVAANRALAPLLEGVDPALLQSPANVLRIALHPHGLAPRILNLAQWREHLLTRLRHQVDASADAQLEALLHELEALPCPVSREQEALPLGDAEGFVVPLRLRVGERVLTLFSTTTLFGTPMDVTLAELAIETFFAADAETAGALAQLCPPAPARAATPPH